MGWAKLGEPGYQHIGFELWTMHTGDFTKVNKENIEHMETFLTAWADTPEEMRRI